ncbi:helix-turn-helix domain-containing protein [Nocardia asiatica]|uniref:helix-turn-helix domain-containing protein n=1 Tax=Nocardia asiatica TaxID=209252 RepID=UPI0024590AEA|nr:helix-turn-helix transcriptional regulator [Nocardia asiatica]
MAGSTLPRRALGRLLRELRTQAKKSQLAAGLSIDVSPQSIGRMEDGQPVKISTPQMDVLLAFYNASDEDKSVALGLHQEVKAAKGDPSGWWRTYADVVNSHFDHYMSLEEACSRLTTFQLTLLPGLLQTPAYRRSMIVTADPQMSAVDVERRIELAARRQARVQSDEDFSMDTVLSEAALRHHIGGRAVMEEQLRHLLQIGELPNVSIRVIPMDAGSHIGLVVQSFTLFEFPALRTSRLVEPPVVFVEGYEGGLFLEDARMIDRYRDAIQDIHRLALSHEDTRKLVEKIAEEYAA